MATNDGYTPYPIGLTALEARTAIVRAFNLTTELAKYSAYSASVTPPTLLTGVKDGDQWSDNASGIRYSAYVDVTDPLNHVLVFIEV